MADSSRRVARDYVADWRRGGGTGQVTVRQGDGGQIRNRVGGRGGGREKNGTIGSHAKRMKLS